MMDTEAEHFCQKYLYRILTVALIVFVTLQLFPSPSDSAPGGSSYHLGSRLINGTISTIATTTTTTTSSSTTPSPVFWDTAYQSGGYKLWDSGRPDADFIDAALREIQSSSSNSKRVLEIGCGTGENLLYFQQLGSWDCYCVELSQVALSKLQAKPHGSRIHAFLGNVAHDDLPLDFEQFDVILLRSVLYHLTSVEKRTTLRKLRQLLAKRGVVVDKEYDAAKNRATQSEYNREHGGAAIHLGPNFSIDTREMVEMFEIEKFEKLDVRTSNCTSLTLPHGFVHCVLMVFK
jgi:SAM-dependent methyltransferase